MKTLIFLSIVALLTIGFVSMNVPLLGIGLGLCAIVAVLF